MLRWGRKTSAEMLANAQVLRCAQDDNQFEPELTRTPSLFESDLIQTQGSSNAISFKPRLHKIQHERDARAYIDFFQSRQSLVTASAIFLEAVVSQFGFRRSRC
jgi:hypothetical protein